MKCKARGCGGVVIMAETTRGRRIALDAVPDERGTYVLKAVAFGLPLAEYLAVDEPTELPRHVVHAASCAARKPPPVRGWRGRAARAAEGG